MNKEHLLPKLTLIVPTYERQEFVRRLIHYWADKGPYIIVLDGSHRPIESKVAARFGPKVRYIHGPASIYKRLERALDLIETEFVALAGDDEFYIPSAVEACITELERDEALVACCGRAVGFTPNNFQVSGFAQYPRMAGYKLTADRPSVRLVQHMGNYVPTLVYAICRSGVWKTALKYSIQIEFPFFAAGELQFQMCLAFAGKSKVIPELMWLRSHNENGKVRGTDLSLNEQLQISDWWNDSTKVSEHEQFISIMSHCFNELLPNQRDDLRQIVVAAVGEYLNYCRWRKAGDHQIDRIFRRMVVERIPKSSRVLLKNMLSLLPKKQLSTVENLSEHVKKLQIAGVNVDFSALGEIQEVIVNFHKNRNSIAL